LPQAGAAKRRALGIDPGAFVIGFVGRLVKDKGIIELARAWRTLREERSDRVLLLIGPVEERDAVPTEILTALRSDPRVTLRGLDWDTPSLYAAMDVLVLPTYREGFPTAPLEAAAMELPVVASRVPGCIDAVGDGVTGILVPAGDAQALTDAIRRYHDEPELRRKHGAAGRARALESFRQEAIWAAMASEYHSLTQSRRDPL
jgi:glycosyltransferase involved in cell wall biosynthesis